MANKRRCNVCRQYVTADSMMRVGSVNVCSESCRDEKLTSTRTKRNEAAQPSSEEKEQKATTRKIVKERDGDRCLLSGKPGPGLHLHRIRYGSEGGEYVPENCVLLANEMHNPVVHANKKLWKPLLLAHVAGEEHARHALRQQLRELQAERRS